LGARVFSRDGYREAIGRCKHNPASFAEHADPAALPSIRREENR
jgi:hypothetical protein